MKVWNWIKLRPWASAAIALAVIVAGFFVSVSLKTPKTDADWTENLAVMPRITMEGDRFSLAPVMDWSYTENGPAAKDSTSFAANITDIRDVWLMVEPQPGQAYAAHTLLIFEFNDGATIALTVEARLEADETYDAVAGMFNNFELAYMWNTSKEVLTRRATYLKKDIYIYPLVLSTEQKQNFLRNLLQRTVDIKAHPRFYNTLASNCTNELAKAAKLPWHPSWILTGYSPQRLFEMKLIPGPSFDDARNLALIGDEIRAWSDLPTADFNTTLLAELHRRHGQ